MGQDSAMRGYESRGTRGVLNKILVAKISQKELFASLVCILICFANMIAYKKYFL
jgi:hypothetical protein